MTPALVAAALLTAWGLAQPGPVPRAPNKRPGSEFAPASAVGTMLTIGDAAPALRIEKWVKQGEGQTSGPWRVPAGRVGVVEFWASWCAPCTQAIPRLTELQERFRDRGVLIVGIASQEMSPSDLERFVERQGERIGYALALDENGLSNQDWMLAAGQRGIPTAFIVDQQGRVAWIGHPLDGLDAALENVVEGKHDLAAAAATHRRRVELDARAEPALDRFRAASDDGEHEAAIAAADELVALDPQVFGRYAVLKLQIQAVAIKDLGRAAREADQAIAGPLAHNAETLTSLAQVILDDSRIERPALLPVAARAAARAAELVAQNKPERLAAALGLRARIAAEQGSFAEAVELMNRAVEAATNPAEREALERRRAEYQKEVPPA